jgi:riboflavin kinase/FMN adenylyltransferase
VNVYYGLEGVSFKSPVITIGMFDGVHLGHRQIIDRTVEIAGKINGEPVVMSFEPHPRLFFDPQSERIKLLTSLDEKISLLENYGISHFILFPFTGEFAALSSREFIERILVKKIGIKHLVAGYNHHFGRNREGSFQDIIDCAGKFGFGIDKLEAFRHEGTEVSSSLIRHTIGNSGIETANKYLGYCYRLSGTVVKGNNKGRLIGFPTANIEPADKRKLIPDNGVYAVKINVGDKEYNGLLNTGTRPTINETNTANIIEAHILGFNGDIYGKGITITFLSKLRNEKKFGSLRELKLQIESDINRANADYFS